MAASSSRRTLPPTCSILRRFSSSYGNTTSSSRRRRQKTTPHTHIFSATLFLPRASIWYRNLGIITYHTALVAASCSKPLPARLTTETTKPSYSCAYPASCQRSHRTRRRPWREDRQSLNLGGTRLRRPSACTSSMFGERLFSRVFVPRIYLWGR